MRKEHSRPQCSLHVTVAEMGNFRWLTVGPVEQPDIAVVLMSIPGPPMFEPETAEQLRGLMAKGVTGGLFFETDAARRVSRS